jgi:hypothetical protein
MDLWLSSYLLMGVYDVDGGTDCFWINLLDRDGYAVRAIHGVPETVGDVGKIGSNERNEARLADPGRWGITVAFVG